MLFCKCKNSIKKVVAIALPPFSTVNRADRPLVISDGLHFVCEECAKKLILYWQDHNKGRTEQYLVESAEVNVTAKTKNEFAKNVLPQLINQFKKIPPYNWYIAKTDIGIALKNNVKL